MGSNFFLLPLNVFGHFHHEFLEFLLEKFGSMGSYNLFLLILLTSSGIYLIFPSLENFLCGLKRIKKGEKLAAQILYFFPHSIEVPFSTRNSTIPSNSQKYHPVQFTKVPSCPIHNSTIPSYSQQYHPVLFTTVPSHPIHNSTIPSYSQQYHPVQFKTLPSRRPIHNRTIPFSS